MKKEVIFKVQGKGFLYKVVKEPMQFVEGGVVYRLYIGRKRCVKRIWTNGDEACRFAVEIVLGHGFVNGKDVLK